MALHLNSVASLKIKEKVNRCHFVTESWVSVELANYARIIFSIMLYKNH